MKLWSRGLGRTELDMDFRRYKVVKDTKSSNVFVLGRITDPVDWEFKLTIYPSDIAGCIKLLLTGSVLWMGVKNFWRYFQYLFNKKDYIQYKDGIDLVEVVNSAYDQLMSRSRGTRERRDRKSN